MFKRIKDGNFALGLIIGGGFVLLLLLSLEASPTIGVDAIDVASSAVADCSGTPNDCANNDEGVPDRWYWLRRFFALEDTLAQWIMMAFTVAAAVLLLGTLKATRGVGQDQSRAYIHADRAEFFWGNSGHTNPKCRIYIKNSGQTPAKWYEIATKAIVYNHDGTESAYPKKWSELGEFDNTRGRWNAIPPDVNGISISIPLTDQVEGLKDVVNLGLEFANTKCGFAIFGEITYCTFFDEIFVTQFVFGRHGLPEYSVKSTENKDLGGGVSLNTSFEEPIPLSRFPFDLKVYEQRR